jgi:hypothetical protein
MPLTARELAITVKAQAAAGVDRALTEGRRPSRRF